MLPNALALNFECVVHNALQKENTRGANDIEPGVLAFAMQQHDPKSRVLMEQLRSTGFPTFINPDRWNAVLLESVVDNCDCQPSRQKQRTTDLL